MRVSLTHSFNVDSRILIPDAGELRDHEVYSCHVSPDGKRLATAAGGKRGLNPEGRLLLILARCSRSHLVDRGHL